MSFTVYFQTAHSASQLLSIEMESVTQVQILNEAFCISLHANALAKCMNPSLPSLAMSFFRFDKDSLREGKLNFNELR